MTISSGLDPCPAETGSNPISSPLFTFRQTSAAGLAAFSLCVIPKDTIVLTLPGPYASIVMRKWRKEVCAWCFKWRYAAGVDATPTSTWEASAALKGNSSRPVKSHQQDGKRDRNSHFLPGLWCCGPLCLASWIRDFELWEGEDGGWVVNILGGFEKALGESTRREREKRFTESVGRDRDCMVDETSQVDESTKISTEDQRAVPSPKDIAEVDISTAEITPEFLDQVWSKVENLSTFASGRKRRIRAKAEGKPRSVQHDLASTTMSILDPDPRLIPLPDLDPMCPVIKTQNPVQPSNRHPVKMPMMDELELDTAKFVLDGMIRKVVEQFRTFSDSQSEGESKSPELTSDSKVPLRRAPHVTRNNMSDPGLWKDFMLLQDNELEYIRSKPYMLDAGIKIYGFLKGMVWNLSKRRGRGSEQEGVEERKRRRALEMLVSDLENFEIVRAILGRDPGNVFGIWEEGDGEESEMYGWGAYVFGSFFNHDCTPNLKKRRVGRSVEFSASRDVIEGDELSIAYVEGDEGEEKTNARLSEGWFFRCRCERCRYRS